MNSHTNDAQRVDDVLQLIAEHPILPILGTSGWVHDVEEQAKGTLRQEGCPTSFGQLASYDIEKMTPPARDAQNILLDVLMLRSAIKKIRTALSQCSNSKARRAGLLAIDPALYCMLALAFASAEDEVRKQGLTSLGSVLDQARAIRLSDRKKNALDECDPKLEPQWVHAIQQWSEEGLQASVMARRIYKNNMLNPVVEKLQDDGTKVSEKLFPKCYPQDRGIYEHVLRIRKALRLGFISHQDLA
jgi:hypothetical protein